MGDDYHDKLVDEIIDTEKSYLKQLETIKQFFSKPILEKGLLSTDVHTAIFGQLSAIYQINSKLYEELVNEKRNIGKTFLKLGPFLKVYSSYANNFNKSICLLEKSEEKNEAFKNFIRVSETRPEVQCKLISLLITPIQRIPRYRLLLEQFLKITDCNSDAYQDIKGALSKVSESAKHINQSVDEAQSITHLLLLQKALKNQQPSIIAPGRKLIKEGILNKVSRKGNGSKERLFFLFTDMLMYTKIPPQNLTIKLNNLFDLKANTLECCCVLPLRHCKVTTLFGSNEGGITFRLQCSNEDLLLYSACATQANDWIAAIKSANQDAVRKRKTLRKKSSRKKALRRVPLKKFVWSEDEEENDLNLSNSEGMKCIDLNSPALLNDVVSRLRNVKDCLTPTKFKSQILTPTKIKIQNLTPTEFRRQNFKKSSKIKSNSGKLQSEKIPLKNSLTEISNQFGTDSNINCGKRCITRSVSFNRKQNENTNSHIHNNSINYCNNNSSNINSNSSNNNSSNINSNSNVNSNSSNNNSSIINSNSSNNNSSNINSNSSNNNSSNINSNSNVNSNSSNNNSSNINSNSSNNNSSNINSNSNVNSNSSNNNSSIINSNSSNNNSSNINSNANSSNNNSFSVCFSPNPCYGIIRNRKQRPLSPLATSSWNHSKTSLHVFNTSISYERMGSGREGSRVTPQLKSVLYSYTPKSKKRKFSDLMSPERNKVKTKKKLKK